jgi:hypothetical protein
MNNNPEHPQVSFVIRNGSEVLVDERMVDILTELKRLGVDTLFSCQGNESPDNFDRAYVSCTSDSFGPVLQRLVVEYDTTELHLLTIEFIHHVRHNQDPRIVLRWPAKKHQYFYELFRDMVL